MMDKSTWRQNNGAGKGMRELKYVLAMGHNVPINVPEDVTTDISNNSGV